MTLITLADGRKLDIAVSGPADGVPVVLHQTTPGSKVQGQGHMSIALGSIEPILDELAKTL